MKGILLILFVKNPVPGKVKTRLAASVGAAAALEIYNRLLRYTLEITLPLACDKVVYYSDFIPATDQWSAAGYRQALQSGDDLGQRMCGAFEHEFAKGYQSIIIIGSDCPELNTGIIQEAFNILEEKAAVIGPASDGGYYLLGMRQLHVNLFQHKQWSTHTVFEDTIKDLQAAGLRYGLLPVLTDIDEAAHLQTTNFRL